MTRRRAEPANISGVVSQALAAHQTGALGEAERLYNRVLAASPDHPLASYNLALILVDSGRLRAARIRLQSFLKAQPQDAPAYYTLGKVFQAEGDLIKSIDHFRRAQALAPDQLDTYLELIGTYGRLGRFDDAREIATVASRQRPRAAEIPTKLGLAMLTANRPGEAREQFERALAVNPRHVLALYNLGKLTDELGDPGAALALYRRARDHDPSFEPAAFNIAELELRLGEVELAIAEIEALLKLNPGDAATLSSRLMAAQYERGVSATTLMALHRAWDRQLGDRLPPTILHQGQRSDPDRRLRVGLVSPDLGDHPVGYFTIGAVEGLDPAAIELVAYAGAAREDAIAGRFRRRITRWRDTTNWPDEQLAEHIARERIDILIDLSGHTRGNRLPAFSRRPAPVQLSWAGYVGTTGLKAIDGLIADRFHIPLGEEAAYGEKIIRLPDGYICFDPPAEAPDVTPLPAGAAGPSHICQCSSAGEDQCRGDSPVGADHKC
jgi:protein O-GlcNAc transferase